MHCSNKNVGGNCHENITKLNLANDQKNILYCINTKHIFFFVFFSLFIVTKKKTDSNIVNQSGDITAHNY